MAYLISAAGIAVECRLVRAFEDKIEIYAPDVSDLGHSLNRELKLALTETISLENPGEPTRLAGTGSDPDQYILHLAAPHHFWDAALAAQADNRRRAFRVRTMEFGTAKTRPLLKLISHVEQGESQFTGTPMDLSLGGCSLQFPRHRGQRLPKRNSQVVLVLEAPFLGEALRLPAQVVRHFTHTKSPRISLRFEADGSAEWLRKEYRLQDYLMERQREQIRFRAA
ncbi:MAG: PilZ domain-containing protein [bacterium]|nr:PilZ domain-containing protein [bacterium]